MTYHLNISFTANQLQYLQANNLRVHVAHSMNEQEPNLAWLTFAPFMNNEISWEEAYSIYVSKSSIQEGSSILMMAYVDARTMRDRLYSIDNNGYISDRIANTQPDMFTVENNYTQKVPLTIGLGLPFNLNGYRMPGSPITAYTSLPNTRLEMKPDRILYLWLGRATENATVISLPDNAGAILLSPVRSSIKATLNEQSGTFIIS